MDSYNRTDVGVGRARKRPYPSQRWQRFPAALCFDYRAFGVRRDVCPHDLRIAKRQRKHAPAAIQVLCNVLPSTRQDHAVSGAVRERVQEGAKWKHIYIFFFLCVTRNLF